MLRQPDMAAMIAMLASGSGRPLQHVTRAIPVAGKGELLVRVGACGICRTDLHVIDGEIPAHYPVIPGHEIVGRVMALGAGVDTFEIGDRVGIPWLGHSCGTCSYCREGHENLCDFPGFTGATRDGGYATHAVADARYCFALPDGFADAEAAPLLCAGMIGWRAYRMAGECRRIGLYGFGASAHILAQLALWEGREVFAFTRADDLAAQDFARSLGCQWAGASDVVPPAPLDAAIVFAPVGALVPQALTAVRKGGRVICAGIHMSDIPSFPYAHLWGERRIESVANLTREDGTSFLEIVGKAGIRTVVTTFPLDLANEVIARLRRGEINGAAVLIP